MAETERDWDEQVAVTGRPQDTPAPNTTFAERAAARRPKKKAVQSDEAENKAVTADKPTRKRAAK
jgi:hypothetical protein